MTENTQKCDGIVEVDAYVRRDGVEVSAYTRSCGYDHSNDTEEYHPEVKKVSKEEEEAILKNEEEELIDEALTYALPFEGFHVSPYLDTGGIRTVGPGINAESESVWMSLAWRYLGGPLLTREEKKAFYKKTGEDRDKVMQGRKKYNFSVDAQRKNKDLESFQLIYLDEEYAMELGRKHMRATLKKLKVELAKRGIFWDKLSRNRKLGALDMAYNLGVEGYMKKFPIHLGALREGKYEKAAFQSERPELQKERNDYVKNLFLDV